MQIYNQIRVVGHVTNNNVRNENYSTTEADSP